jgi:hypothetical protein
MSHAHWSWRKLWPLLLLLLLTLGEYWLFRCLLFANRDQTGFVLANLDGILTGTPVWKASQHRVLAPLLVSALERLAGPPVDALACFMGLGLLAENALLFWALRSGERSPTRALCGVAALGFAHVVLSHRLEYPWDSIDLFVFTAFGCWAATRGKLWLLIPLLLVGCVNHETALYIPLWCALARFDHSLPPARRKHEQLAAGVGFVLAAAGIFLLREVLYVGPANLADRVPERVPPWLENPIHLSHNLRQFLWLNWRTGHAVVSASLLIAGVACALSIRAGQHARAALWSLAVLGSVFVFGYVNETRLYLAPVAFWFGYLGVGRARAGQDPGRRSESR